LRVVNEVQNEFKIKKASGFTLIEPAGGNCIIAFWQPCCCRTLAKAKQNPEPRKRSVCQQNQDGESRIICYVADNEETVPYPEI